MEEAHHKLKISHDDFDRYIDIYVECFRELEVDVLIVREVMDHLDVLRKYIVYKPNQTLCEMVGGEKGIQLALDNFLPKLVNNDKKMKDYFKKINMDKLKENVKIFLISSFNGYEKYEGKGLREIHEPL
jgi:hemoglobin